MSEAGLAPLRRALISVSDKTGIVDFARALSQRGVEILSTGGTCRLLREEGLTVTEVSDHTGFPEMMDGRVKTLHYYPRWHPWPTRHRRDSDVRPRHCSDRSGGREPLPLEATVARPDCSLEDAVENIDIGGPTMVRAAAKNHRDVAIVVSAGDYDRVLAELESHDGHTTLAAI